MSAVQGWFGWALLAAIFAALTAIFAKVGVEEIDPDLATLLRSIVIVVLLALFVVWTDRWQNPLTLPSRTLLFLLLSALAAGASWVAYFRALKLGDTARVAAVDRLSLALVALFALLFLGERPTTLGWAGIALMVTGVLLLGWGR